MARATHLGVAAGIALAVAAAGLSGPATATPSAAPTAATPRLATNDARPDTAFDPTTRAAAIGAAKAQAPQVAKALGLGSDERLHVHDVVRDADGTTHVRYNRTLGGLKVFGGDFIVHRAPSGAIESTDFASDNPLAVRTDVRTKVSGLEAARIVAKSVGGSAAKVGRATKVVWAVDAVPRLAWLNKVVGHDKHGNPIPRAVVVDARTGKKIQSWDLFETAKGKGRSLYVGTVNINTVKQKGKYLLRDAARGGSFVVDAQNKAESPPATPPLVKGKIFKDPDNTWGNGKPSNRQSAAVDVAYGVGKTWDYFKQTFNRNGIADNGKGSKSRVHYGVNYDNAFWFDGCFCMTYGDGSGFFKTVVGLDVAGHEMTHGVTSRTAGLYYFGDQGGLNEATSDIFGTLVEFFAKNKKDKGDYYIGDKIMGPGQGTSLRRMDNPKLDGVSFNCWTINTGLANPHYSSGPGNHFFYLLAEGSGKKKIGGKPHNSPRCGSAGPVQGVGRAKAGAIWYRALTRYFTSTESYPDARDATIRAAQELYTPAVCAQVQKAWDAINVAEQYWDCGGRIVAEGPNSLATSPGFEPNNAVWSSTGTGLVTNNGNFGLPRSGDWYGTINGQGVVSNGTITRQVDIPNDPTPMLRFYLLLSVASSDDASVTDSSGTVTVSLDPDGAGGVAATTIGTFDESHANNTYVRWDLPIPGSFAGDNGVTLTINGHENAPAFPGQGYFQSMFDDFTITPN